jgi:hypothetical protein
VARQYLEDAFGPDGIRVTIAIEPTVDRFVRAQDKLGGSLVVPVLGALTGGRGRKVVQEVVFAGAWVVDVETDAGERVRVRRPDHSSALALAKATWRDVVRRDRHLAPSDRLGDGRQQREADPGEKRVPANGRPSHRSVTSSARPAAPQPVRRPARPALPRDCPASTR